MEEVTRCKRGVGSRQKAEQRMVNRTEEKKGREASDRKGKRTLFPPGPVPDSQITEEYSMKRQPV
jgi:hypothetical protein